jgi:membrane protease YdiL (CAAX protease family)
MALLAPLLEEVLFRGAIQGILMRHFGKPWPAIIVASLIFGIFHWNPIQAVYATLLGMVLGWIYYRTGSLLSVIVGHVLNNSIAVFTTIAFGAAEEEEIANSSPGIAAFIFFAVASIALALKVKAESCE